jgi:hypothetical protein
MIAFEVHINGKKICTAGLDSPGVVSQVLNWVKGPKGKPYMEFRIGGLVSKTSTNIGWDSRKMKVGDDVRIVLVETKKADKPIHKSKQDKRRILEYKKKNLQRIADELGWKVVKPTTRRSAG